MVCKCSGKYIDIYFGLKITFMEVLVSLEAEFNPLSPVAHTYVTLAHRNLICCWKYSKRRVTMGLMTQQGAVTMIGGTLKFSIQ